jgi:hypothetical protein
MLPEIAPASNWLAHTVSDVRQHVVCFLAPPRDPVSLERPSLSQLARPEARLPRFVAECAVTRKYLDLLGPLDWEHFPERDAQRPWPGPPPARRAPFVAAYLVKLDQPKRYMSDLRQFLVEHPALVWALGFELAPAPAFPWGFDVQASLPSARHFGRVLRTLPNPALQFLLDGTVTCLQRELPPEVHFGQAISIDTKHILAWVMENNPKAYLTEHQRLDKTRQPRGDRDCKLGCKKKHNPSAAGDEVGPARTPTTNPKPPTNFSPADVYYWGYASGVAATKVPEWGEFALAELTQTFDRNDITYFLPLIGQVERRLGFKPPFGAFDAAFDPFYVFEYFHAAGGFAAVPLAKRGGFHFSFDDQGRPLCQAGLAMPLKSTFMCHTGDVEHQKGRYACPLLYPQPGGATCPIRHKNWPKGGCTVTMATSIGARLRYQIDRDGDDFKALYKQRTATERINSQAVELGIERPKLRNRRSIANQNTLIYVLINLRAIQRVRARKAELAGHQEATTASS